MAVKPGLQYSQVLHLVSAIPGKRLTTLFGIQAFRKKVLKDKNL